MCVMRQRVTEQGRLLEELLQLGKSLSPAPPSCFSLAEGDTCFPTQVGPKLAREYQGTLYPGTIAFKVGISSPGPAGVKC